MKKFVSILLVAISFNFLVSFSIPNTGNQPQHVDLTFSNNAIAIESGQPVFNKGTKIWLTNPRKEKIKIFLNEQETVINSSRVELSKITLLSEGTYTLIVNTYLNEQVFGFTIK